MKSFLLTKQNEHVAQKSTNDVYTALEVYMRQFITTVQKAREVALVKFRKHSAGFGHFVGPSPTYPMHVVESLANHVGGGE